MMIELGAAADKCRHTRHLKRIEIYLLIKSDVVEVHDHLIHSNEKI